MAIEMQNENETRKKKKGPSIWARRKARRALVQAVYQWQVSATDPVDLQSEFTDGSALAKADKEFFAEILVCAINDVQALDSLIDPLLDRPIARLDLVERGILRLATVELRERIDVPYRVVIDEYVELAKVFGAQDSYKYINGVLDKLALQLRKVETRARPQ
jgi:N utilization substance protein B